MYIIDKFDLGASYISTHENILTPDLESKVLDHLGSIPDWYGGDYDGRQICRTQRWYHQKGEYFNDDWPIYERWKSHEYSDILLEVKSYLDSFTDLILSKKEVSKDKVFNSLLINRYLNGQNLIPKHRDSEKIFGDNPVISVLSLNSERTMRFTRVDPRSPSLKRVGNQFDIVLKPNSLLIMAGTTQKYYCHEILRSDTKLERYSLTYRYK